MSIFPATVALPPIVTVPVSDEPSVTFKELLTVTVPVKSAPPALTVS